MMLLRILLTAKSAGIEPDDINRMIRAEPARSMADAVRILVKACETAEAPPKNQSSSRLDDFLGEACALFAAARRARMEPEDIIRMARTDPARCAAEIARVLAKTRATAAAPPKNQLRKTGGMAKLREMTPPSGIYLEGHIPGEAWQRQSGEGPRKKACLSGPRWKVIGSESVPTLGRMLRRRPRRIADDPIRISPVGGKNPLFPGTAKNNFRSRVGAQKKMAARAVVAAEKAAANLINGRIMRKHVEGGDFSGGARGAICPRGVSR